MNNVRTDLVARVLPDVPGFERELDYLVPAELAGDLRPGSIVRVPLQARKVRAWVLAFPVEPPAGVALRSIATVSSWGPEREILELATWAAWRWAGRRRSLLVSASPAKNVKALPRPRARPPAQDRALGHRWQAPAGGASSSSKSGSPALPAAPISPQPGSPISPQPGSSRALAPTSESAAALVVEKWPPGTYVIRLPPASGAGDLVVAAARRGPVLVLAPTAARAEAGRAALRARGANVALLPEEWAQARAGADIVIGARGAAWGPCPEVASVVVLDAHDEAYVQGQAPTWSAAEVVAERARRSGAPCFWVTPCPTLEMLAVAARVWSPSRAEERAGWAACQIVDRRRQDPRDGLFSPRVAAVLRDPSRRVVCVLNRKGRSTLLDCAACGELATCERCGSAVAELAGVEGGGATAKGPGKGGKGPAKGRPAGAVQMPELAQLHPRKGTLHRPTPTGVLGCRRCGGRRPFVCAKCGSTALRALRLGVSAVREQAEALAGREVAAVTAASQNLPDAPVLVATEAVLYREAEVHKTGGASVVVFLDFDQDLLAPRYRAGEEALALLARASRLVGGRSGTVIVQTRSPAHPVLRAALLAEPSRLAELEAPVRRELRLPPFSALALLSGPGGEELVGSLRRWAGNRSDASRLGAGEPPGEQGAGEASWTGHEQATRGPGASEPGWLEVNDLGDGRWLVRASSHEVLSAALACAGRPKHKVRVEVAPARL